jgi:hypothetical protein
MVACKYGLFNDTDSATNYAAWASQDGYSIIKCIGKHVGTGIAQSIDQRA